LAKAGERHVPKWVLFRDTYTDPKKAVAYGGREQVNLADYSFVRRTTSPPHDKADRQAASKSVAEARSQFAVYSAVFDTERSLGEQLAAEV
jgi:hypothetical protein